MPKVNDHPPKPEDVRIVAAGVDSLYLGYAFDLSPTWERELEQAKQTAARARKAGFDPRTGQPLAPDSEPVPIAGVPWAVRPYGASAAPYLAWHERIGQWALAPDAMNNAPVLQVKVFALALWRDPTARLVALFDGLAAALSRDGGYERRYVQRVDVAIDFQGWAPELDDLERFCKPGNPTASAYEEGEPVEEFLEEAGLWVRWKLSGFRFGKSGVVVRLYCKTEEIRVSGKGWFKDVWRKNPLFREEEPVWRLEVQVPREFLKDLRVEGTDEPLESVEDVLAHLGDVWRTVLTRRIRLTLGDASRNTRATTNPAWDALVATTEIDGVCDGGKVTIVEQDRMSAEELLPKVRGYLASWASLVGEDDLPKTVERVRDEVAALCDEQQRPFPKIVRQKRVARAAIKERATTADINARAFRRKREREATAI